MNGTQLSKWRMKNSEKFILTKIRLTLIQVFVGAKYDAKLVPNLPSVGEKK